MAAANNHPPLKCVVIDAGARYGLHPTWVPLRRLGEFHLFEMDGTEAERLRRKYSEDRNIVVLDQALYSEDTTLDFEVREHRALNSIYASNEALLQQNQYKLDAFSPVARSSARARSIDSLFGDRPVHFIKLDVEGAEFEILKGARRTLRSSVLGVRSEVLFAPILKNAPMFGDLNALMLDAGFELLNLDYSGAGNRAGRFTMPGRFGKLMSTDAVWIIPDDALFSRQGDELLSSVVLLAIFLLHNGATDLAIDLLLRAANEKGVAISSVMGDPLGNT